MNTTTPTITPTTDLVTVPATRRRHRTAVNLVVALVVALAGLLSVGAATPASAAGTGAITVCFKHTNGAAYTYDQYAQRYTTSGWVNAGVSRSVNGCIRWTVGAGQYWRFQAFYRVGHVMYQGTSAYLLVGAGADRHLGTYWVYQYNV